MNKKELIEKYKDKLKDVQLKFGANFKTKVYEELIEDIKQLGEPKKVVVEQFVDDYIKHAKEKAWDLQDLFEFVGDEDRGGLREWFYDGCNQETLALAWIFGYEVKKEKRYYVRFKGMESDDFNYLNFIKFQHAWVLSSLKLDKKFRTEHTKKQLEEANFGWVFYCEGIEIEEVE